MRSGPVPRILVALPVLSAQASPVCAQEDGPPPDARPLDVDTDLTLRPWVEWTVQVEPIAWFPALNGDLVMPGGARFEVEALDLDENRFTPSVDARITFDRWTVGVSGFIFNAEDDVEARQTENLGGFVVEAGDRVDTDVNIGIFQGWAGYRVYDLPLTDSRLAPFADGSPRPSQDVAVGLDLLGGVRVSSVSFEFEALDGASAGERSSVDETWVDPFVGLALDMRFSRRFGVNIMGNIGGFSTGDESSLSWEVRPSFEWLITDNVGLEVGFRHVQFEYDAGPDADDFDTETVLAGLFGALVIRF